MVSVAERVASEEVVQIPALAGMAIGMDYAAGPWPGIAGSPGLPAEVRQVLGAALDRVRHFEEFQTFMAVRATLPAYGGGNIEAA
jgi:tripartite-type tricarboxylate transporter receptor subunit TctC